MRYKDLLIVICLIAAASWIWAEPVREVVPVPTQPYFQNQDWTVPDLDLEEAEQRISAPGSKSIPLSDFERFEETYFFATPLEVSVAPGHDFNSTRFDILVPETFQSGFPPGESAAFEFILEPIGVSLGISSVQASGPFSWTFFGSDLFEIEKVPGKSWDRSVEKSTVARIKTFLPSEINRYSRGSRVRPLESPPFRLLAD